MQGAKDTHVSQAMFIMHEVMEMLRENTQPIRMQNVIVMPFLLNSIPTEDTQVTDLTPEAPEAKDMMGKMGVKMAEQNVERLPALMGPRRKLLDDEQLENGSLALRRKAEKDFKAVNA